jgi:hypothetical protein
MTNSYLLELYKRTLEAHHCLPKDGELDSWAGVLGDYSRSQLDAALRRWDGDTSIEEYSGKPRGSRMPSPAELKRSMEDFERSASSLKAGRFVPCNQDGCDEGWIRVFTGRTVGTVECGAGRVDPKGGAVRRCQCFQDWANLTRKKTA